MVIVSVCKTNCACTKYILPTLSILEHVSTHQTCYHQEVFVTVFITLSYRPLYDKWTYSPITHSHTLHISQVSLAIQTNPESDRNVETHNGQLLTALPSPSPGAVRPGDEGTGWQTWKCEQFRQGSEYELDWETKPKEEDNIKMDLESTGSNGRDPYELAQDRD